MAGDTCCAFFWAGEQVEKEFFSRRANGEKEITESAPPQQYKDREFTISA